MSYLFKLLRALIIFPYYFSMETLDYLKAVYRYYPNKTFRSADLRILYSYLLRNPYAICKHFVRQFPDDQVQKVYGETFFSTLALIADAVQLEPKHCIYDLGCGRGRSIFWFHAIYGCEAVGVEINPLFVHKARRIQASLGLDRIQFKLANLLDIDYANATHIYLYGSVFSEEAIMHIIEVFKSLKTGTRVISVTYPLTDYLPEDQDMFELEQEFTAPFLWGYTGIYIQKKC